MILKTWDEHGEREHGKSPNRTMIDDAIASLNWASHELAGVTLVLDSQNWADGSGCIDPEGGGLSLMIEDRGVQHVSLSPPRGLNEIADFLHAYAKHDLLRVYEILYERTLHPRELEALRVDEG